MFFRKALYLGLMLLSACAQTDSGFGVSDYPAPELTNEQTDKSAKLGVSGWWHQLADQELSALVELGLQDNLSLQAQELRLKSSALTVNIARADLFPNLTFNVSATSPSDDFGNISSASLGLASSWEIDLWGSIAATENKARWDLQVKAAQYRAKANLIAGSITNTWLGFIAEQQKKQLLADQFKRTQDALSILHRRFAMGKSSVTTIWQQQKLLKSIEVQQEKNRTDLFNYQQTLALWLGGKVERLPPLFARQFPRLPELVTKGIDTQLLKQRPDIEQAFAKIKAANEHLAMAIAARYPRFTLRANYSTSKNSVKDLFDDWAGNLIAALALPIVDAGERKAVVQQRKLTLKALLLEYQEVWLTAISSVQQVLADESQLTQVAKNLADQLVLAVRTEKLTTIKFLNGKTNYLDLLKAQESILSLERQLIDANKKVMLNRVLLYRELSHGNFVLSPQAQLTTNTKPEVNA